MNRGAADMHRGAAAYAAMGRHARALGASPHELVSILYDELALALAVAHRAAMRGDAARLRDERARASALLATLDGGLDVARGGATSATLAGVYAAIQRELTGLEQGDPVATLVRLHGAVQELARAWAAIAPQRKAA